MGRGSGWSNRGGGLMLGGRMVGGRVVGGLVVTVVGGGWW